MSSSCTRRSIGGWCKGRLSEYRTVASVSVCPCVCGWVVAGVLAFWRSGALALCFFVPARLLEGQTPSFQMFDFGDAGGFDDQLQPLPCPVARPHGNWILGDLVGWTVGWLAGLGWAGWADGLNGRVVGGWMEGSTSVHKWSPAQSTTVSHLIRQNADWDWKRAWVKTKRPARHMDAMCRAESIHCFTGYLSRPHSLHAVVYMLNVSACLVDCDTLAQRLGREAIPSPRALVPLQRRQLFTAASQLPASVVS